MGKEEKFRESAGRIYRMITSFFILFGILVLAVILVLKSPELFNETEMMPINEALVMEEDDFDKIENGIHVRTGLVDAEGLMTVVNNCTNCHSAKIVMQNRMSSERWKATIRWMQETQNLWDLGKNEDIIVNYLVTNYPAQKIGRRKSLSNIDWYELED